MEQAIISRLISLVATGRLDIPAFFRACTLAGISFAAAAAAISATPAWSKDHAVAQAYRDVIGFDLTTRDKPRVAADGIEVQPDFAPTDRSNLQVASSTNRTIASELPPAAGSGVRKHKTRTRRIHAVGAGH